MRAARIGMKMTIRGPFSLAANVSREVRGFLQRGLTRTAFHFDRWTPHGRIALVLSLGQICMLVGMLLRVRVGYFIQSLYPDYMTSEWAPFAKSLVELSLCLMVLGLGLTLLSLNCWMHGLPDRPANR
jgi:hypothetical protein